MTSTKPIEYLTGPDADAFRDAIDPHVVAALTKRGLAEMSGPMAYGAVGDGASHKASEFFASLAAAQAVYPHCSSLNQEMDWLALQAAFNAGGPVVSKRRSYKLCNSALSSQQPLVVVAGTSWTNLHGSILDASAMVARTTATNYVSNADFASATGWQNATIYSPAQLTNAVFGGGAATYTDPAAYPGTAGHFCQFGQLVTLAPGSYRAMATVTVTRGASYANGNPNPPYGSISFFETSPGEGGNPTGRSASLNSLQAVAAGGSVTQTIEFSFTLSAAKTMWFTFSGGGYANFAISEMSIRPYLTNCAILCTRDGSPTHYPIYHPLSGFTLQGGKTGSTAVLDHTGLAGIRWNSFSDIDGNLVGLRDANVTGFDDALALGDGAYLVPIEGVNLYGNGVGVYFPTGRTNAGENIRFVNGGIFNNKVGVDNPGAAEMTFFGTAIDYNTQALVNNAGRVVYNGLRVEMPGAAATGKPLFHFIGGGSLDFIGGYFLGSGAPLTGAEPPISFETNNSAVRFHGTEIYNLSSFDTVASGPGLVLAPGGWKNNGNPNVGGKLISRAAQMDVFAGAGKCEDTTSHLVGAEALGIDIEGGLYTQEAGAVFTNRWTAANFSVAPSTAQKRSGTRSIKLTKANISAGSATYQVVFLIPVRAAQNVWSEFWWLAPDAVGTGTAQLYVRQFWVRQMGLDALDRPVFGRQAYFKGEVDISVPLTGSATWNRYNFSSAYMPGLTDETAVGGFAGAPPWATHYGLLLDTQSLPTMSIWIDDFVANVL
ncbi:hypothetical protein [Novosphingobium sp.]|uniref:hypothetical protein n=1 Tax=Novosphingobium sp. TaxID=1874826 RepID=UPI0038BACF8F